MGTDGGSETSGTTTDEAATTTAIPDVPQECVCEAGGTCDVSLCAKASLELDGYGAKVNNLAALQCALTALRDRTPGMFQWQWCEYHCFVRYFGEVWVRSDGTARVSEEGHEDCAPWTGPVTLGTLREPEYFDACLAEPDPAAAFECLRDPFVATLIECAPLTTLPCGTE